MSEHPPLLGQESQPLLPVEGGWPWSLPWLLLSALHGPALGLLLVMWWLDRAGRAFFEDE